MKAHYYRLAGRSLTALNRLIDVDRQGTEVRMADIRRQVIEKAGTDALPPESGITRVFKKTEIAQWQRMLGFKKPAVVVRNYADGLLYRAYNVFPKMAMNPGTSKANFGLRDFFRDSSGDHKERVAIYTSYENYKGKHFAPPDAVKLTDDEFHAYDPQEDDFEYYRTYDEGTAMPADFDPAKHKTVTGLHKTAFDFTDAFLIGGAAQAALADYKKKEHDSIMPYQDFRNKIMGNVVLPLIVPNPHDYTAVVETAGRNVPPVIRMYARTLEWEKNGACFDADFEVISAAPSLSHMGQTVVIMRPRPDTQWGAVVTEIMADLPPRGPYPVDFGFEQRPVLENSVSSDAALTGFPFMQIERFGAGGDDKLLVFRMPSYIAATGNPPDCTAVTLDEYRALGGVENAPHKKGWPTQVFRIGGALRDEMIAFDKHLADHGGHVAAMTQKMRDELRAVDPDHDYAQFKTPEWDFQHEKRELELVVPDAMYERIKPWVDQRFHTGGEQGGHVGNIGWDHKNLRMVPRTNTAEGREWHDAVIALPLPRKMPGAVYTGLGFNGYNGYDLMRVQEMNGLKRDGVLFSLPPYMTATGAPPDCTRLTREEYALVFAESADLQRSSPPPPRPAHLMHLPLPQGVASYESLMAMKRRKDKDGLPLHQRTEFNWFQKPRGPG